MNWLGGLAGWTGWVDWVDCLGGCRLAGLVDWLTEPDD